MFITPPPPYSVSPSYSQKPLIKKSTSHGNITGLLPNSLIIEHHVEINVGVSQEIKLDVNPISKEKENFVSKIKEKVINPSLALGMGIGLISAGVVMIPLNFDTFLPGSTYDQYGALCCLIVSVGSVLTLGSSWVILSQAHASIKVKRKE